MQPADRGYHPGRKFSGQPVSSAATLPIGQGRLRWNVPGRL